MKNIVSSDNLSDFFVFENSEIHGFDSIRRSDRKIVMLLIVMRLKGFLENIVLYDLPSNLTSKYLDEELQRILDHAMNEEK